MIIQIVGPNMEYDIGEKFNGLQSANDVVECLQSINYLSIGHHDMTIADVGMEIFVYPYSTNDATPHIFHIKVIEK